jgi:hypothetical protein
MGHLSFKHRAWSDRVVRVVDISSRGVGVESDGPMEPGLVWFHNSVGDYRSGILVWSRKQDERYRAGIRFLPLTAEDEWSLRNWPPCPGQLRSCSGLEKIISTSLTSPESD